MLKTRVSILVLFGILIIGTIPFQEVIAASTPVGLGFLDPNAPLPFGPFSSARGVSADGAVIVGSSKNINDFTEAYMWTQGTGIQGLGFLAPNFPSSTAFAVSADGSVIVGASANSNRDGEAFRWTQ